MDTAESEAAEDDEKLENQRFFCDSDIEKGKKMVVDALVDENCECDSNKKKEAGSLVSNSQSPSNAAPSLYYLAERVTSFQEENPEIAKNLQEVCLEVENFQAGKMSLSGDFGVAASVKKTSSTKFGEIQTESIKEGEKFAKHQHRKQRFYSKQRVCEGKEVQKMISTTDANDTPDTPSKKNNFQKSSSNRKARNMHVIDSKEAHIVTPFLIQYPKYSEPKKNFKGNRRKPQTYLDKEHFVQANFRLFLYPENEKSAIAASPDALIDWAKVARVDVICPGSAQASCPICLDDIPLAPRITKCGHVFCGHCILRYISSKVEGSNHRDWKRCPICFESIYKKDLKVARIQLVDPLIEGKTVDLCLLHRAAEDSLISLSEAFFMGSDASSKDSLNEKGVFHSNRRNPVANRLPDENTLGVQFFKTAILSNPNSLWREDLQSLREAREINYKLKDFENVSAVDEAILFLEQSLVNSDYHDLLDSPIAASVCASDDHLEFTMPKGLINYDLQLPPKFVDSTSSVSDGAAGYFPRTDNEGVSSRSMRSFEASSAHLTQDGSWTPYSFYQESQGRQCYLSPLVFSCLVCEFGLHSLPPLLSSMRILYLKEFCLESIHRRQYKFLAHLPLATNFAFVDVDIDHLISPHTKAKYKMEFSRLAELRNRTRKKREKIRASEEADQKNSADDSMWKSSICGQFFSHHEFCSNPGKFEEVFPSLQTIPPSTDSTIRQKPVNSPNASTKNVWIPCTQQDAAVFASNSSVCSHSNNTGLKSCSTASEFSKSEKASSSENSVCIRSFIEVLKSSSASQGNSFSSCQDDSLAFSEDSTKKSVGGDVFLDEAVAWPSLAASLMQEKPRRKSFSQKLFLDSKKSFY